MEKIELTQILKEYIDDFKYTDDGFSWYYISYGEKCWACSVIRAIVATDGDIEPPGGTQLELHQSKEGVWVGENGTEMIIYDNIASIDSSFGLTVCKFIARAYTELVQERNNE